MKQRLWWNIILFLIPVCIQAQDHDPCTPSTTELTFDSVSISVSNEAYWDSLTSKLIYDSDKAKDVIAPEHTVTEQEGTQKTGKPKKEEEARSIDRENNKPLVFNVPEWLGKLIMYVLGGILIGVLVYLILKYGTYKRNVKNKQTTKVRLEDLSLLEENLPETDLEPWLKEALGQKNYEMAIRLYYLRVVQALSEKKLIFWKKDKTNQHFIEELYQTAFYKPFTQLTYFNDLVFYGQRPLTESIFQQWLPKFRSLLQEIEAFNLGKNQNQADEK